MRKILEFVNKYKKEILMNMISFVSIFILYKSIVEIFQLNIKISEYEFNLVIVVGIIVLLGFLIEELYVLFKRFFLGYNVPPFIIQFFWEKNDDKYSYKIDCLVLCLLFLLLIFSQLLMLVLVLYMLMIGCLLIAAPIFIVIFIYKKIKKESN